MPPTKPWLLPPKKSLRIFEGLEEVLDNRQERRDVADEKQQRLEDRIFGKIRQDKIDDQNEELLEARIASLNKPKAPPPLRLTKITGPDGTVQFVDPSKPPSGLRERVPGGGGSESDAVRLNARIKELTSGGLPLSQANAQARQEYGYAPPRPPRPQDGPTREHAADVRAGESKVGGLRREFQQVLGRRPKQSQFVDPLTRMADTTAFNESMPHWRADSTEVAGSLKSAQDDLAGLRGDDASRAPSAGAGGGGRAGGGNPVPQTKKRVSAADLEKARTDPEFAAWLRRNGYDVGPPR